MARDFGVAVAKLVDRRSNELGMMAKRDSNGRYDFDRVVRLTISAATLVAVIALLRYLSDVLIPFVVALLLAYLLNPVVNAVESRVKNRGAAVLVTVMAFLFVMIAAVFVFVPVVTAQLVEFRNIAMELRQPSPRVATTSRSAVQGEVGDDHAEGATLSERFEAFVAAQKDTRVVWILTKVREFVASDAFDLEALLLSLGKRLVPGVWGVVTGAVSFLLGLTGVIVILLYVVFLLNDFRRVQGTWKEQLPPAYRDPVVAFLQEFADAMGRYFRGQFVVASCVGVLFAIGFWLVGLRMGILLGLCVGMLNMVPYAQMIGLIPAALLAILSGVESGSSVTMALVWTMTVFAVVQLIQDAVLTPRILGKATGLRPAVILLGVFVWGKLLGFLGVVLAIPLTCLGLAYYRRFVLHSANE